MKNLNLLLLLISLQGCSNSNTKISSTTEIALDTITYKMKGFNSGVILTLLSDGTFNYGTGVSSCFGTGETKEINGTYTKTNAFIKLSPNGKVKVSEYFPKMSRDAKQNEKTYTTTYFTYGDSIKIKTKYNIVNYGYKEYLLSEETINPYFSRTNYPTDFERFASSFNENEFYHGDVALNRTTKDSVVLNLKQIPKKWQAVFSELMSYE